MENFRGWLLDVGAPFERPFFVANSGLSKVLVGPNGFGKSKFLKSLGQPGTVRIFNELPDSLKDVDPTTEYATPGAGPVRLGPCEFSLSEDFVGQIDRDPSRCWAISIRERGSALVTLTDPQGGDLEAGSWQVHVAEDVSLTEAWITPDAGIDENIPALTRSMFVDWVGECLPCLDARITPSRNPLVGRGRDGRGASLLAVAETFCEEIAERTRRRIDALVGFDVDLRIAPEEDFYFYLRLTGEWFPYAAASAAIRRWIRLAAMETLREYLLLARGVSQFHEGRYSAAAFLEGEIPEALIPRSRVSPFATESAWIMLDEPEVHLFGSEAQKLGESLARVSKAGRLVVATHSLELASALVGRCEFFTFTMPGAFEFSPPEEWASSQLASLAAQGPGVLSGMKVLYVEGIWDARILQLLYSDRFRESRIVVCPTHGTLGAAGVVTSVWQRLIGSPCGVMFDVVDADETERAWRLLISRALNDRRGVVRGLLARARGGPLSNEDIGLMRVQANVLEAGMERNVLFLMHGLSDIFQVVSPRGFGANGDSWAELGLRPRESFKAFVRLRYGVDLSDGATAERVFGFLSAGEVSVDRDAKRALDDVIEPFLAWNGEAGSA